MRAMTTLTITKIGNSEGVILPKEILAKLHVAKGDKIFVSEIPGGIALKTYDPELEQDMALAEEIMRENRNALRKLAE
jgi:putative addiction module antidote